MKFYISYKATVDGHKIDMVAKSQEEFETHIKGLEEVFSPDSKEQQKHIKNLWSILAHARYRESLKLAGDN